MWNPNDQNLYVTVDAYLNPDRNWVTCGLPRSPPPPSCSTLIIDGVTNEVVNVIPVEGYDFQEMAFNLVNNRKSNLFGCWELSIHAE